MSVFAGPNIETAGILFYYDSGNPLKWKPATNTLVDVVTSNTITLTNAQVGNDIYFNGANSGLVTTTVPPSTSNTYFSIEAVFKSANNTNNPIFVCPQNNGIDHFFRLYADNSFQFQLTTSADVGNRVYGLSGFALNIYHHVVCVKDGDNIHIYKNGILGSTVADALGTGNWGSTTWAIGNRGNGTFWFTGEIPLVKFYDQALSPAEVRKNFNAIRNRYSI
jgi:hypothetical protein